MDTASSQPGELTGELALALPSAPDTGAASGIPAALLEELCRAAEIHSIGLTRE